MWGRTRIEDAKLEDITVDIYTILKCHKEFDTNRKGCNDLSPQEIRKGYIFEPVSDGHVSVVIAPEDKDCGHSVLVLLRFNESFHGGCTKLNDWHQHKLFEDVSKLLSHQGYECHRFGGSSGKTSLDKHFFKFLHKPTTFPRLLKVVKLVQRDFTWEGIYVSPLTGKMVKHSYSTPIPGGVFQVSKELAEKYSFFTEFAEYKMMAAFVLHGSNKLQEQPKKYRNILIAPDAVAAELKCLKEVQMKLQLENQMNFSKQQLLLRLSCSYKHTLVQHPVGFHQDVFGKGDSSKLENRRVFYNYAQDGSSGRGGFGLGTFAYAILDW